MKQVVHLNNLNQVVHLNNLNQVVHLNNLNQVVRLFKVVHPDIIKQVQGDFLKV